MEFKTKAGWISLVLFMFVQFAFAKAGEEKMWRRLIPHNCFLAYYSVAFCHFDKGTLSVINMAFTPVIAFGQGILK